MNEHLSASTFNGLADGELTTDQLTAAMEHMHRCPACTSAALEQSLLKSATARTGHRYTPPEDLAAKMQHLIASEGQASWSAGESAQLRRPIVSATHSLPVAWAGWLIAACLLLFTGGRSAVQMYARHMQPSTGESEAWVTEVSDQHIATLAANLPPQVVSSSRHTVKPWFQGKLPFTFNLPDNLPDDTTLEGANLTYLHNRPTAQLLYRIGMHRVSVFVSQPQASGPQHTTHAEQHAGFHLASFDADNLQITAVSDVEAARLDALTLLIGKAQTK